MLLALTICLPVQASSRGVIVDSRVETYPVQGDTIREIQRSIGLNTPSRNGDSFYAGETIWSLSAKYAVVPTDAGCRFQNGKVHLTLRVRLPMLTSTPKSEAVRAEWERFHRALTAHEVLHQQNAYRAANDLKSKLSGTQTALSCVRAKQVAERAIQSLIERISQYDKELDRQTRHGATQGAALNLDVR